MLKEKKEEGTIELYKYDKKAEKLAKKSKSSSKAIFDYISQNFQKVEEMNFSNVLKYQNSDKKLILAAMLFEDANFHRDLTIFRKVASIFPQLNFAFINFKKFKEDLKRMKVDANVPSIVCISFADSSIESFDKKKGWNEKSIKEWIDAVLTGKTNQNNSKKEEL